MGAFGATIVALNLTSLPKPVLLLVMCLAAIICGGLWAALAGVLKVYFNTNETIITLMLNYVALKFITLLHSFPVSAMSESPTGDEVWVGTTGGGAFRVDSQTGRSGRMLFGPLETGVSALTMSGGSLWMGGMGKSPSHRSGLTTTGSGMARWQWLDASFARIAGARAFDLAAGGDTVWVASDLGLARASLRTGDLRYWNRTAGFTGDVVFSVLRAPRGAWAGTAGWINVGARRRSGAAGARRTRPHEARARDGDDRRHALGGKRRRRLGAPSGSSRDRPQALLLGARSGARWSHLGFAAHDSVLAIAADHGAELVNLRTGFILPAPRRGRLRDDRWRDVGGARRPGALGWGREGRDGDRARHPSGAAAAAAA